MAITITDGNGKQFFYADGNPLRFVQQKQFSPKYKSRSFDDYFENCYAQPFVQADTTVVQILSDLPFTFKVWGLYSNLIQTITSVDKGAILNGYTMHVYEVPIAFANYPLERYFCEITVNGQTLQSEPFEIAEHSDTILFEYTNSENDFSLIFTDTFLPAIRCAAVVSQFVPQFADQNFIDQGQNITLLDSEPFRKFTLSLLGLVPNWMIDRINRALSCDVWSADGEYYQKADGAQWVTNRPDPSPGNLSDSISATIEIREVTNEDAVRYESTEDPNDEVNQIVEVSKRIAYPNTGADLVIANVFQKGCILKNVLVQKTSPGAMTLKIGVSNGAAGIGMFDIAADRFNFNADVGYPFDSTETLYISGLAGNTADVFIGYDDLNAKPINIPTGPGNFNLGIGAGLYYHALSLTNLNRDFDLGTGYGKVDTDWVDFKIDTDAAGVFFIGYDGATYDVGQTGGNNSLVIQRANLPAEGLGMFDNYNSSAGGDEPNPGDHVAKYRGFGNQPLNYEIVKGRGQGAQFVGATENMGQGTALDIRPAYRVQIWVYRYQKTM